MHILPKQHYRNKSTTARRVPQALFRTTTLHHQRKSPTQEIAAAAAAAARMSNLEQYLQQLRSERAHVENQTAASSKAEESEQMSSYMHVASPMAKARPKRSLQYSSSHHPPSLCPIVSWLQDKHGLLKAIASGLSTFPRANAIDPYPLTSMRAWTRSLLVANDGSHHWLMPL